MIDISFPLTSVHCGMKLGTAKCECVLPIFHEYTGNNTHICRCGAAWNTQRTTQIINDIEFEPDYRHPHGNVGTGEKKVWQ